MQMSQFHYLPLAPGFFTILVGAMVLAVLLLEFRALRHAYLSMGVSPRTALALLCGSLIGSYFNIPIAQLAPEHVMSDQTIDFFGMQYTVPMVTNWPGTVIAVNVGGAVIPTMMSIYLLAKDDLWIKGAIGTAIVAVIIHWLANPVQGLGIAVPVFMPAITTAIVASVLSREFAAPLAYIAGGLGTLIGADLTNLDKVRGWARRWPRSAAPEHSTAFSSPASSRCCWPVSTPGRAPRRWDNPRRSHRHVTAPPWPRPYDARKLSSPETVMILGLSLPAFTLLHVIISLIGIGSGIIVLGGLLGSRRLPGWTALFLVTTVLTSVTGLLFPGPLTPGRIVAIVSLIVLAPTLIALYGFHLRGAWRWIYAGGATIALYLNVFVLVAQSFAKIPVLQPLAPTQSEPPFLATELFVLAIFILLGVLALKKFHPEQPAAA